MQNIDQAIREYEYILHALDKGVSVQEIREELYRMEHEGSSAAISDSLPAREVAYAN